MSLKALFGAVKQPDGLVKKLDQYLISSRQDDPDRRHDVNSPSQATACLRAMHYARIGAPKALLQPRVLRIFDNGSGVHWRLQNYLERAGLLLMREAPVFDEVFNIQGHTDGILEESPNEISILEIKSINSRGFAELKAPKSEHTVQAQSYLYCVEEHRKYLRKHYKTPRALKLSWKERYARYETLYQHLQDDPFEGGKSREEKLTKKIREHMLLDDLLYKIIKPVTKMVFLYESKDNQEIKEFVVEFNMDLMKQALQHFAENNSYAESGECPPRVCSKKPNNTCDFADFCFK